MEILGIDFQPIINWFVSAWTSLYNAFSEILTAVYEFVIELMFSFFRWAAAVGADFIEWAIANVPDPCCFGEFYLAMQWFANLLSSSGANWLAWMFSFVEFEAGFRIVLCAMAARFLLRRIPFIN